MGFESIKAHSPSPCVVLPGQVTRLAVCIKERVWEWEAYLAQGGLHLVKVGLLVEARGQRLGRQRLEHVGQQEQQQARQQLHSPHAAKLHSQHGAHGCAVWGGAVLLYVTQQV